MSDFLVWLTAGGSVICISWIAEQIPWFATLLANTKRIIQFVLSAVLGCAALAVTNYVPQATLDAIAPYFAIFMAAFGSIFVNQTYHNITRSVAIIKATEGMLADEYVELTSQAPQAMATVINGPGDYEKIQGKVMARVIADLLEIQKLNPNMRFYYKLLRRNASDPGPFIPFIKE
jgi:uncharacterized membrane protein